MHEHLGSPWQRARGPTDDGERPVPPSERESQAIGGANGVQTRQNPLFPALKAERKGKKSSEPDKKRKVRGRVLKI